MATEILTRPRPGGLFYYRVPEDPIWRHSLNEALIWWHVWAKMVQD
jgi:hypothetical protein